MNDRIFDLEPAAISMEAVVSAIAAQQLEAATPCDDMTVGQLLAHVAGLTEAFRRAATKESIGASASPTQGLPDLPEDWRGRIPAQLKALVSAWRDPAAWEGDTEAGGVTLPATEMARVALNELIIHTWDLARATGQPCCPDSEDMTILVDWLRTTPEEGTPGLFGPVVPIPDNAPTLDKLLGLTGRDPTWTR
ncbi:TIGR03086 family protein [Nocardia uniformis]|uniref:TIGR03086 family protein n=1 Tax=Nocardia uniformis TaxID=53432 RepID=A0A849CC05_9NOCA|nr:TIGR03086 family metal-binding protein [Nocardia uniformis]NNH75396.1 TIGR03086 family protein [Nocardia uniformis]